MLGVHRCSSAAMARHREDWWAKRVAELARSGDADAIARRHKVRVRTLVWWRSELARRAREKRETGPRLLPVVVATRPNDSTDKDWIEVVIEIGAARVSARGALSPEHLVALVGRVVERC